MTEALRLFKAFFLRIESQRGSNMNLRNVSVIFLLTGFVTIPAALWSQPESLTLEQAIEIGLRNNYSILISKNNVDIADNNASLGNAGFLPSLDATGSTSKSILDTRQEFANGSVSDRDGAETTSLNGQVALNWTIFDGFNMFTSMKQLNTLKDIGEINAQAEVENSVADIIAAYHFILQQQQLLRALGETITISKERADIAEGKYNIGSASRLEWNRARVDLIADSSAYLRQQTDWENSKTELNRLLARDSDHAFTIADSIDIRTDLGYDDLLASAQSNSKDLQIAEKNMRLANLRLQAARSERFPVVTANVGYGISKTESDAGFFLFGRNRTFSYGISARLNLFNGFNTTRREQNAKIDIRTSELEYDETQDLIEAELAKVHKRYQNSLQIVKLEAENVLLARQNVDIALEQFRLGAITSVDLREVQNNFVDSETRFLVAQLEAKLAETELLRLSGQLIRN